MATCDADTSQLKVVQQNSAKQALDQAKRDYEKATADSLACQGASAQGSAAVAAAAGELADAQKDVDVLVKVQTAILKQLGREAKGSGVLTSMAEIAGDETIKAEKEIEELRSEIRKERRRFLDADPSAPTSFLGLYYTREPDNQVLIAFMVCVGLFLLFISLIILFRIGPIHFIAALDDVGKAGYRERLSLIGGIWGLSIVVIWIFFFTFT